MSLETFFWRLDQAFGSGAYRLVGSGVSVGVGPRPGLLLPQFILFARWNMSGEQLTLQLSQESGSSYGASGKC